MKKFSLFRMFAAVSWIVLFGFIAANYEVRFMTGITPAAPDDLFGFGGLYVDFEFKRVTREQIVIHGPTGETYAKINGETLRYLGVREGETAEFVTYSNKTPVPQLTIGGQVIEPLDKGVEPIVQ